MPIDVSSSGLRLTTGTMKPDNAQLLPGIAKIALARVGPLAVDSTGRQSGGSKSIQLIQALGASGRAGYYGFSWQPSCPAGQAPSTIRGAVIEGFTGVTPGGSIFIADAADVNAPIGLTHTAPSDATYSTVEIPLGTISATGSFNIIVPDGATVLAGIDIADKDAVTADNTNYWTFALTNKGNSNAVMLAATDANTTKATGGSGITAYTKRSLALTGVSADLVVSGGQVLELSFTKTASATTMTQGIARLRFTSGNILEQRIGVGVGTTGIRID